MPALTTFSAMIFGTVEPYRALQTIAEIFGASTIAIGRVIVKTGATHILVENSQSVKVRVGWAACEETAKDHFIVLSDGDTRDIIILQTANDPISQEQRRTFGDVAPFLAAFWGARETGFAAHVGQVRIELTDSILHRNNPYNLTRTEVRICHLISEGLRPKDMIEILDTSMATMRTHLGHIYAKTGLDGMISVLHHLQSISETQKGDL